MPLRTVLSVIPNRLTLITEVAEFLLTGLVSTVQR